MGGGWGARKELLISGHQVVAHQDEQEIKTSAV